MQIFPAVQFTAHGTTEVERLRTRQGVADSIAHHEFNGHTDIQEVTVNARGDVLECDTCFEPRPEMQIVGEWIVCKDCFR